MRTRILRFGQQAAVGGAVLGVVVVGATIHVGTLLTRPVQHCVGPAPTIPPLEAVEFKSRSGIQLRAWYARGMPGAGGIALIHGIRSDRRSMLGRAKFLHRHGYSVLLIDLQAHGESEGKRITFGALESHDVQSSIEFLRRQLPGEPKPIGVIGASLGGAACVLGSEPLQVDALVLEAVYPDVTRAIRNRLRIRLGPPGVLLAPLLTAQIRPRLGIAPSRLRPVDGIPHCAAPILIIAGGKDRRTTLAESEELYAAAPEPKDLWIVPGAAHVDLHNHAPPAYESRVLNFFERHMTTRVYRNAANSDPVSKVK